MFNSHDGRYCNRKPWEHVNLAADPSRAVVKDKLFAQLRAQFDKPLPALLSRNALIPHW
eukprot:m.1359974 g.1359974  ORF g.1359974 m.1359974 type:complete len:59 (-) comp24939_c0_seq27:3229-3405(-)